MNPASTVYFNGSFVPYDQASFGLEDRGVLFGDGVYEVVRYDRGRAFGMQPHVDRLADSMAGIDITGVDAQALAEASDELVRRNGLTDAKVYWQVTRGVAHRDFVMPADPSPTVSMIVYPATPMDPEAPLKSGSAVIADDCRWTRCHIKSLLLMPASLAKTRADAAGAVEAIFERAKPGTTDKHITEGCSTNVFIVEAGQLVTHPTDGWILPGITRTALIDLAGGLGIEVQEVPFTRERLLAADEAFVCSTTQLTAITSVDGASIGNGQAGPVTDKLHHAYLKAILEG